MTSAYDDKIWLDRYPDPSRHSIETEFETALEMFAATAQRVGDGPLIEYYDNAISARELDELSDAFAAGILDAGFNAGERVVIYAQNIPQFVIAQLGT